MRGGRFVWPLGVGSVCLAGYLYTLAPGVVWGDAGEIVVDLVKLGAIHPTGYPLYTVVGHLFTLLPLPFLSPATKVALFSAVAGAAGVLLFFLFLFRLTRRRAASAVGALAFGLSPIFWSQCRVPEVYSVHVLLNALVLVTIARLDETPTPRLALLLFLCLGLGFAHHMMTGLIVPAAAYLLVVNARRARLLRTPVLLSAAALFCLPLLSYAYLFLPTWLDTGITWSGIDDGPSFLGHITASQYRYRMAAGLGTLRENLVQYLVDTMLGFSLLIPLALIGAVSLCRRNRRMGIFSLLYFGTALAYALTYRIPDIGAYFLPAHLVLALWIGCGVARAQDWIAVSPGRRPAGLALAQFLVVLLAWLAFTTAGDLKGRGEEADRFARETLGDTPARSIVLVQGEGYLFALWYAQSLLGLGADSAIVSVQMKDTEWYVEMVRRRYPWMAIRRESEKETFVRYLLENNPRSSFFSINTFGNDVPLIEGYDIENQGWVDRVVRTSTPRTRPISVRNTYLASEVRGQVIKGVGRQFPSDGTVFLVVDWALANPGARGEVRWVGPDGRTVSAVPFDVDRGHRRTSYPLEGAGQKRLKGAWIAEIHVGGCVESALSFDLD